MSMSLLTVDACPHCSCLESFHCIKSCRPLLSCELFKTVTQPTVKLLNRQMQVDFSRARTMAATGAENPFRVPGFDYDGMGLFSDQMADLDPSALQPGPYYGTNFDVELNNVPPQPVGKAAPQPVTALHYVTKPLYDLMVSLDARLLDLTAQYVHVFCVA